MTHRSSPLLAALALALLVAAGCTVGTTASRVYQAEGVTLTLDVRDGPHAGTLGGELLAVERDAYVIDAVSSVGAPVRVARVPFGVITRGAVYASPARTTLHPALGRRSERTRRIGRLGERGTVRPDLNLILLSRFPHGFDGAVRDALLARRGQTEIAPFTDALIPTP